MFIAKYLDQKQGEARVVDRQAQLRQRLETWLQARPSAQELAERGVLGREQRFAIARGVVDRFLRARQQAHEAEIARVPPGDFEYSDRLYELLGGSAGEATLASGAAAEAAPEHASEPPAGAAPLKELLARVLAERDSIEARLREAGVAWAKAAEDCRAAACGPTLPDVATGVGQALALLESYRATAGASLKGVFEELHSFQRLVARRQCLEGIVAMVNKTEVVREAIFACGAAETLPLAALEEVPALCRALPAKSRELGARRLKFIIGPLRTMLTQELEQALKQTGQWPRSAGQLPPPASAGPEAVSVQRVLRLCADLQRVQRVQGVVQEGLWACSALAAPLAVRFRQLFCREDSDLCRMDKPEWAFKYLLENLLTEHGQVLEGWLRAEPELDPVQAAVLESVDLLSGLAVALAHEAGLFLRARMPVLAEPEEKPTLLHTLQQLVRFHGDITAAGGCPAGAALMADFDANRPLRIPAASKTSGAAPLEGTAQLRRGSEGETAGTSRTASRTPSPPREEASSTSAILAGLMHGRRGDAPAEPERVRGPAEKAFGSKGALVGGWVMAGLSHLARGDAASESVNPLLAGVAHLRKPTPGSAGAAAPEAAPSGSPGKSGERTAGAARLLAGLSSQLAAALPLESANEVIEPPPRGFLDVWAAADAEFMAGRLATACAPPPGGAWKARPLRLAGGIAIGSGKGEEPEAAELAGLLADLFRVSGSRGECLSTKDARSTYALRVLEPSLKQAVASVRGRWNDMRDPLAEEARESALLAETMEEICRFLDSFPFAVHFAPACDEANELRLSMLGKLAESLSEVVRKLLRKLDADSCIFSFSLAPALLSLSRRLRPSSFRDVAQRGIAKLADVLWVHLQRRGAFQDEQQLALFLANCGEDLYDALAPAAAALGEAGLTPLGPLRDACGLLALPGPEAEHTLEVLQRVVQCAPSAHREHTMPEDVAGSVLQRKGAEVLAAAGVRELGPSEAIIVICKRPDLAASLPQDPLSVLQELLPASAAQSALQLGAGALQQLHAAPLPMPVAAMAQATLQTGVLRAAELRGLAGGAGRRIAGRLRSTLTG